MYRSSLIAALVVAAASPSFARTGTVALSNQTVAAGINVKYAPGTLANPEYIAPCASGDFDNDGDEDLFVPTGGGANGPDKLYRNEGNGTFVEVGAAFGLTAVHRALSVAVGDIDDDGFLDLYVPSAGASGGMLIGQNKLYRNVGGASFTEIAASAGVPGVAGDSYGTCFGDYNLDGRLDLFVTGFNSKKSRLYRNNGNSTFTDQTSAAGIASGINQMFGFACRFVDTNGDRYPELLCSGDFGTSRYFRNNAGVFVNFTAGSGTAKDENGMGGTSGDFDRDGDIDWYVTSIYQDPGNFWTGNKLYRNNGAHSFTEISGAAGVGDGGYGWGAVAVDFDHDRWLDLAATNGAPWSIEWINERTYLWRNNGNDTFTEISAAAGFNELGQGRGMINFDYDLDGDQDLFLARNNEFAQLWRNDLSGSDIHWLRVKLDTQADSTIAPNGYGATVRVTAGGITQTVQLSGGDNLQSQSELFAHFGLGAETTVAELAVEWTNGRITKLQNVAADQTVTVATQKAWTDLGGGVPGSLGPLVLTGSGTLNPGATTTIAMTGAVPGAAGTLFVGLFPLNAPLYGGVFVPSPQLMLPFNADGAGALNLIVPWPAGLPNSFPIWMQVWCADPAATFGAAASNGLKAVTP
jgi:hypothetical protein